MKTKTLTLTAAAGVFVLGISLHRSPGLAPAGPIASQQTVITRLVGRDQTITIFATPTGPRYSVATPEGKLILANVTLLELRQKDPASYTRLNSSITWAGMDTSGD